MQPILHRVRGACNDANMGVPGLDEDSSRRGSRAVLVRDDTCYPCARIDAVDQDRQDRRHRLDRAVGNEIRGDHQQRIHLMITKRGQSVALMITIIGRIHVDQQVPRPCRGLQGRVQHALRESNRARPGQHPDGTRTPATQTERNGVGRVVQLASRVNDRLLLVSCDMSLRDRSRPARPHSATRPQGLPHLVQSPCVPRCPVLSRATCKHSMQTHALPGV
jgi:hypothetical protein